MEKCKQFILRHRVDLIVVLSLFVVTGIICLVFYLTRPAGDLVTVELDGEVYLELSLYDTGEYKIADTGNIMPPKTTWFEPKLRLGVVIHSFE